MKQQYREYFRGKKITMLGLGLLGRGLHDAAFLAACGADLTVTDLKSKEELAPTLTKLKRYGNIRYRLGKHDLKDFENRDFILKAAGVPLNSPFIAHAREKGIPIEMEGSLFARLASGVTYVGITGTRGKTTTTYLIYEILAAAFPGKVHLGGNIRGIATLPLIATVQQGDIVVLELDSWQLQGWGESHISPQVSVFTNFLNDHLNYYLKGSTSEQEARRKYFSDKANIFRYQNKGDILVIDRAMKKEIATRYRGKLESTIAAPDVHAIDGWRMKLKGEHNRQNILKAIAVARVFHVSPKIIRAVVEGFPGVPGRLEFIRNYKGVSIYNDTTATTPDATIVALKSLGKDSGAKQPKHKRIVLIMGGADKNLDMSELIRAIPRYCKHVILLAGTGTEKLGSRVHGSPVDSLKEALTEALKVATRGDSILLSPAFASFGMFQNEFDRGDKFTALVRKLS